jgi:hypothetical protein
MGEEGVVLEDGVDVALVRRLVRDVGAVQEDPARAREVETGDESQAGGLAGARGTQQGEELAVGDAQIDVVDRDDVAEAASDPLERDCDLTAQSAPISRR